MVRAILLATLFSGAAFAQTTTLTNAVNSYQTRGFCLASTVGVNVASPTSSASLLQVDGEQVQIVAAILPANCYDVRRGVSGTVPTVHSSGAPVVVNYSTSGAGGTNAINGGSGGASTPVTAAAIIAALAADGTQKIPTANLPIGSSGGGCAYQGYWNSATAYPIGADACDTVLYGSAPSNMYQSKTASTNVIPGSETATPPVYWQQVGYIIPISYQGTYNPANTYAPQQIASYQGSSYIALQTLAPGTTPPSCTAFPAGNSNWGVIACGAGAVASYSLACTPASLTVTQGGNASYTCTVTAQAGFSGTVSFSATNLPSGGTIGFSPATLSISSTAPVTTTATITTTSISPGTYSGIQISSSSGSQTVPASGTNSLIITAPGILTLNHSLYVSPVNLTGVGTDDWGVLAPADASNVNSMAWTSRKAGASLLGATVAMSPGGERFYPATSNSNFTWSDASGTASGSTGGATQNIPMNRSYIFAASADLTVRTLYLYFDVGNSATTAGSITASISGAGAPTAPTMSWTVDNTGFSGSSNGGFNLVTVTYQAAAPGQTLTITFPNAINAGLTAVAVTH